MRQRPCWCMKCMKALTKPSLGWGTPHSIVNCDALSRRHGANNNAYAFSTHACTKTAGRDVAAAIIHDRDELNNVSAELCVGDWIIFHGVDENGNEDPDQLAFDFGPGAQSQKTPSHLGALGEPKNRLVDQAAQTHRVIIYCAGSRGLECFLRPLELFAFKIGVTGAESAQTRVEDLRRKTYAGLWGRPGGSMASLPAKLGGPGPRTRPRAGTGACPVCAPPPGGRGRGARRPPARRPTPAPPRGGGGGGAAPAPFHVV